MLFLTYYKIDVSNIVSRQYNQENILYCSNKILFSRQMIEYRLNFIVQEVYSLHKTNRCKMFLTGMSKHFIVGFLEEKYTSFQLQTF